MKESKSLTRSVYERIFSDVINSEFAANDIVTEGQLMERYGVGKSPVREALITLCDERVLHSIPRAGYRVVQIMPQELVQVTEARQALELFMLEKSFPLLNTKKILLLQECNDRIGAENDDTTPTAKQWQDNVGFHLLLASFADNQYMCGLLENVLRICARATSQYFNNITNSVLHSKQSTHRHFIEACECGDLPTARQYIIEDSTQLLDLWQ